MKKAVYLLLGLFAATLVGCTQDLDEPTLNMPTPELDGAIAINISGSISQTYTTRVDDGGFCDGDQIGLYGVNYTADNTVAGELLDDGNQVDNARFTFDEENWRWVSSGGVYYKDAETNIDLYGYYPYGSPSSVRAYEFEVAQDQSGNNVVDGYSESDFLWGKAENISPSEAKVKLMFNHILASANVVLTEGDGFAEGEFDALSKGVAVMNTTRKAVIDLQTGDVSSEGEAEAEGIVAKRNAEGFRAIVVPQTVEAGTSLLSISVDGIGYRYKNSSKSVEYKSGMQTNMTIRINKKSHTGEYEFVLTDTEIVPWVADLESHGGEARQYYVVYQQEPGTLGKHIREANKNPNKIKNLKISGKISAADFRFMRDSMEILQAVNLKETEITAAWYYHVSIDGGSSYHYEYFEGEMPEAVEEREAMVQERYPDKQISSSGCGVSGYADEIPSDAYSGKESLVHFVFPEKVTKIGDRAFGDTTLSDALIIPNDVEEIGDGAFRNTNISSLQLPHKLKMLGASAFAVCKSLSGTLSLPESLESIGSDCFYGCGMLSGQLILPSKLTEIPSYCFAECEGLTGDLVIPEGVKGIGQNAFWACYGLNGSLTLPQSLKRMDYGLFFLCSFQGELVIPDEITIIPESCFYGCGFSSIVLPEGLIKIEEDAFFNNIRISEPIVFPESLISIERNAFDNCVNLPSIHLKKDITVIGGNAFANCYYLSSITCDAVTPPAVGSGAFDGVAKDNFTVAVPEQSIVRYQTANGWSDFRRIAANHDFSISRPQLRVLNAAHQKNYVLRVPQGEAWSVESQPEWVSVTPSSGIGKTEVTVTVNEMARAEAAEVTYDVWEGSSGWKSANMKGRRGEVVFLLESKDVREKMVVEQYDSDNYDGEVIVNQRASAGGGVNIVFMGDCFDAKDIAEGGYLSGINEAIDYYFGIEPYKSYRDYFNIYTVVGMSPDTGMGTVNTIKEAKFGSQYSLEGIAPDVQTTYEYAMKAESVNEENLCQTLVVMVENTEDYGGICYMWGDGSAIAICPMSRDAYPFDFRGIVQHEAGGHGFAKLADEYIYHNAFIQTCTCICCDHLLEFNKAKALGWYRNLSTDGDMHSVEWSHLIFHPDYSNIVDMYEGGFFHTRGIYRSEATSCMNNNIPYYSAISRQEMVERIMCYGGEEFSLDEFYAKDVRDASNNTITTRSHSTAMQEWDAASRQFPPKYMGDKPQLR